MSKKIRSICVDTLTGIQNKMYMESEKKPGHDQWADIGKDIYNFISALQERGFEMILVLGEPGTGKSSGMSTLEAETNIWFNADNKSPVWRGGKAIYGTKLNPTPNYHMIPSTYQDVLDHIDGALANDMFEEERYAILTGHVESYTSGNKNLQRLKVLGKMATKFQIEGRFETVFYSGVIKEGSTNKYVLETQNSGYNTARSPQDLFEPVIPNDYKFVIDQLLSY